MYTKYDQARTQATKPLTAVVNGLPPGRHLVKIVGTSAAEGGRLYLELEDRHRRRHKHVMYQGKHLHCLLADVVSPEVALEFVTELEADPAQLDALKGLLLWAEFSWHEGWRVETTVTGKYVLRHTTTNEVSCQEFETIRECRDHLTAHGRDRAIFVVDRFERWESPNGSHNEDRLRANLQAAATAEANAQIVRRRAGTDQSIANT